jgi:hypothetical protein
VALVKASTSSAVLEEFLKEVQGFEHIVSSDGFKFLMTAAKWRAARVLRECIQMGCGRSGIDREERRDGLTALMIACSRWTGVSDYLSVKCAHLLVKAGADVMKTDLSGKTCLHHAVLGGLYSLVLFLCMLPEGPALVSIVAKDGNTALSLARTNWFEDEVVGGFCATTSCVRDDGPFVDAWTKFQAKELSYEDMVDLAVETLKSTSRQEAFDALVQVWFFFYLAFFFPQVGFLCV